MTNTDTITETRASNAHERAEVLCPACGGVMHPGEHGITYFNEVGYYSPAPKVVITWRCACGHGMKIWEEKHNG